ncbi:MAG TPA: ArsR family transcriptional regulator [Gammaproteobacteria bacterium]|nr:ArsR family transcriptional regulator [Gammaproteobacteria bacterium]
MSNNSIKNRLDNQRLAEAFKALSNPNRLKIFQQLMDCCTPGTVCSTEEVTKSCVGDLGNGLDIAPSTLSHHIKELSRAGLIRMERRGQHVDCWIDPGILEQLSRFFKGDPNP